MMFILYYIILYYGCSCRGKALREATNQIFRWPCSSPIPKGIWGSSPAFRTPNAERLRWIWSFRNRLVLLGSFGVGGYKKPMAESHRNTTIISTFPARWWLMVYTSRYFSIESGKFRWLMENTWNASVDGYYTAIVPIVRIVSRTVDITLSMRLLLQAVAKVETYREIPKTETAWKNGLQDTRFLFFCVCLKMGYTSKWLF